MNKSLSSGRFMYLTRVVGAGAANPLTIQRPRHTGRGSLTVKLREDPLKACILLLELAEALATGDC